MPLHHASWSTDTVQVTRTAGGHATPQCCPLQSVMHDGLHRWSTMPPTRFTATRSESALIAMQGETTCVAVRSLRGCDAQNRCSAVPRRRGLRALRALGAIQRALCDDKAQKSAHFSILGFGRLNGKWSAPSAVGARYHRPSAYTPARPSPRARSEVQERASVGSGAQRSARALVA